MLRMYAYKKLQEKPYFSVEDVAKALAIKPKSAVVLCSRYVKAGLFLRLKKDFYVLEQDWEKLTREELLRLANFLQVPSYISFQTALSFYEITTQLPRNFIESASLKRTAQFEAPQAVFKYYKLKKEFYFDFSRKGEIFIATPEKAFIDAAYLFSFGKYKLDFSALALGKLDKNKIKRMLKPYPEKTQTIVEKICKI